MDFESKTVLELRKIAKEHGVKLSAGINKAEIIQRIEDKIAADAASTMASPAPQEPAKKAAPAPEQLNVLDLMPVDETAPKTTKSRSRKTRSQTESETPKKAGTETDDAPAQPLMPEETEPVTAKDDAEADGTKEDLNPDAGNSPVEPEEESNHEAEDESEKESEPEPEKVQEPAAGQKGPKKPEGPAPHYRASWHNATPASPPKYNSPQRSAWNQSQQTQPQRTPAGGTIPGFGPRFGPQVGFGPQSGGFGPQAGSAQETKDTRDTRDSEENPRPGFGPQSRPAYDARQGFGTQRPGSRNSYEPRDGRASYSGGSFSNTAFNGSSNFNSSFNAPRNYAQDNGRREMADLPSIQEILTPAECDSASGILEVLPDGYGFLRSDALVPSSHDIYIPSSLVRRYELRSGDFVKGKIRPQRDGEKYSALLYLDEVNDKPADRNINRPFFDDLTPVYSNRKLSLDDRRFVDCRVIDLMAPIGVGSRTLMIFPQDTAKRQILQDMVSAVIAQNEGMEVICLLVDFAPEDVTEIRDSLPCTIIASTFDQTPEVQMRLIDLAQERAVRLAEEGRDVVIVVDSLSRLVRVASIAQQARQGAPSLSSNSLFRAKRLFGTARCAREGGSITVIATVDVESGTKVDDAMVEEFRTTANTEIQMDSALARLNVFPPIQYQRSRTKRLDQILETREIEGLTALQEIMSGGSPASAVQQVLGLVEKVGKNSDVLQRIKDWAALMAGAKTNE